ncbi:hypothetical protein EJ06DRAFT_530837 [Trichodelitschia bisporula]|uniref:Uncharacterized protein n=1 Tax=Trichodelitschia bisporula TaxID=703511 RepID=A0A6G1HVJ5_9PEZI|nr:hypothetical protein EJ06DRAFT_530837 [Trichodelitschia bisporula]
MHGGWQVVVSTGSMVCACVWVCGTQLAMQLDPQIEMTTTMKRGLGLMEGGVGVVDASFDP